MENASIVVIGAGVVGASVAYHLIERGAKDVLLLESELEQGTGSTGRATGGIRAQFETDINIKLSLYSLNFLKNCEFECGYDPKGYLFFATTPEQMRYLEQNVDRQRALGVKDVDLVDAKNIAEIVPGISCSDIVGGSFGRQDGFLNPLALMHGFTESALRKGARLEFGCRTTAICIDGGRVRSVRVGDRSVECDAAVVCTGAMAKKLAATAGIDLPVEPQRRQIVWARAAEPLPDNLPMVIDLGTGFHFRPAIDWTGEANDPQLKEREVLFAYPDPDDAACTETEFEESFIEKVYERARRRAPFLDGCEVVRDKCRVGLYENTPDHHAILGGCEIGGLYFANGFSGHGVMHSPATGRALAEIILDGRASFLDVSCLSLDRFAKGQELHETAFI